MSKSILVIDMPKNCAECPYCGFEQFTYKPTCVICKSRFVEDEDIENNRSVICPLRPLPKMKDADVLAEFTVSRIFNTGWNACLKAIITGETK